MLQGNKKSTVDRDPLRDITPSGQCNSSMPLDSSLTVTDTETETEKTLYNTIRPQHENIQDGDRDGEIDSVLKSSYNALKEQSRTIPTKKSDQAFLLTESKNTRNQNSICRTSNLGSGKSSAMKFLR